MSGAEEEFVVDPLLLPERQEVPVWFIEIEKNSLSGLTAALDEGAAVSERVVTAKWNEQGISVLGRAVLMDNDAVGPDMIALLAARGAQLDEVCCAHREVPFYSPRNVFTPLGLAISLCSLPLVRALLHHGASVQRACFNEWLPLDYALSKLSSRVDRSRQHFSPEWQAEEAARNAKNDAALLAIIEELISFGCPVDYASPHGRHSPLGFAVIKGNIPVVRCLARRAAPLNAVCFTTPSGSHAYTPVALATALRFSDLAQALVDLGAQPDAAFRFNHQSITPSQIAAAVKAK